MGAAQIFAKQVNALALRVILGANHMIGRPRPGPAETCQASKQSRHMLDEARMDFASSATERSSSSVRALPSSQRAILAVASGLSRVMVASP